jgi:uncharacterized protein (TIGR00255 family)
MLFSMTGYGRTKLPINGKTFTVEIKALNSKGLDINVRLHPLFRDKEMDIRNIIGAEVVRGKIDFLINNDPGEEVKLADLNPTLIMEYHRQLKDMSKGLSMSDEKLFELALQLPNLTASTQEVMDANDWPLVEKAVREACREFAAFRRQEGDNMMEDLGKRIGIITDILDRVAILDPERINRSRDRILSSLRSNMPEDQIDMNRFEQELIFYLEKMDITEEITRLRSHCAYFLECMITGNHEKGKKLAFISQEMGREINTIGAKSYHAEMQKLVVEMKDELEKIKEQLNNVL